MIEDLSEETQSQILKGEISIENCTLKVSRSLNERNFKLLSRLVAQFWNSEENRKVLLDVHAKVCKIQRDGGMENDQIGGFKTPGGIFITLIK